MTPTVVTEMQGIAQSVLHRAREQGYVLPREIREELEQAGLPGERWKEVVRLNGPRLRYKQGRYHFVPSIKARMRAEHDHLLRVKRAARQVIRQYRAVSVELERRDFRRFHFVQPVKVFTADGRELNLLARDISLTGIRLIGTVDLRGQRVRVLVPGTGEGGRWTFTIQVLWSTVVGDNLLENGGIFLDISEDRPATGE